MADPRIVVHLTEEGGPSGNVEIVLNDEGLDLLITELQDLKNSECGEHFHFLAPQWGSPDGPLRLTPCYEEMATAGHLKVVISPDKDDEIHFPDVIAAHGKETLDQDAAEGSVG